jgi:hypothetical protein
MSEHKGGLALSREGGELFGSPSARGRHTTGRRDLLVLAGGRLRLRALQDERARAERKGRDKSAQRALRSHLREKGRGD